MKFWFYRIFIPRSLYLWEKSIRHASFINFHSLLTTAIKQKNAVEEELRLQKHLTAMVVQENNFLKKTIEGHSKK